MYFFYQAADLIVDSVRGLAIGASVRVVAG
jgi:hypothetical protein